jgi:hypothetical protein
MLCVTPRPRFGQQRCVKEYQLQAAIGLHEHRRFTRRCATMREMKERPSSPTRTVMMRAAQRKMRRAGRVPRLAAEAADDGRRLKQIASWPEGPQVQPAGDCCARSPGERSGLRSAEKNSGLSKPA